MSERRVPERTRTFLRGRIEFNGGQSSLDCLIRDLSESGARLTISDGVALPDVFQLFNVKTGRWTRAAIRWRRGDQVGVHFQDAPARPVADAAPDRDAQLRELEQEVARLRRLLEEVRADPGKIQTLLDRAL